mmetsp:Transcript_14923/g.37823  ORF Transcript_14923/g.37823 Transcript_14923/m.37823 type:complete len:321 (+) Transcript_14923:343-1305(+)
MEKARSASVIDMVPIAELRRPEKGTWSGERPHCMLMLMRPTCDESASMSGAAAAALEVKMADCWPFHDSLSAVYTSDKSENLATGSTGPNCSSWKIRISLVTPAMTAGWKSAPCRVPPPISALATVAPLLTASAMSSSRYAGLFGSGSGVMFTLSSQGRPTLSAFTLATYFARKASYTDSCTIMSLTAVQRCPLYAVEPRRHCSAATSRSASPSTMPMFLPASCANTLRRCGSGCCLISLSIAPVPPMNPIMSTRPDSMMGGIVLFPEPVMKLRTPGGSAAANASAVRMCARPPTAGSLSTATLPMSSAGMSIAYISFSG